jgi:membrane-associated phospholipid phosphatase
MRVKRTRAVVVLVSAVAAVSLGSAVAVRRAPGDADARMVSEWVRMLYGAIRVERLSPPVASRLVTYAAAALYAGLAVEHRGLAPLAATLNGFPALPTPERGRRYDGTLAAVAAERVVIDSLLQEALPTTRAALTRLADSLRAARLARGVGDAARDVSEALGRRVGLAVVAWSRADGFDGTRGRRYAAPVGPGLWANDAPATTYAAQSLSGASEFVALDDPAHRLRAGSVSDRALVLARPKRAGLAALPPVNIAGTSEPYWGTLRPFALRRWDECAIPAPPPYSTDGASPLYRDALAVHATGARLTAEQRAIALYWADNAGESGTPVGHWVAIASQVVSERRLPAPDAARLVLLTAVAQADAFIASWGYKYRHNLIRPRAYIRRVIDPTWEPAIPTPPFPEYPSGHSTQSAAAAEVLAALAGDAPFDDSSGLALGHAVRRFASFRAAADEAGASRVYAGIHFPLGNSAGAALGRCVGATVLARSRAAARP